MKVVHCKVESYTYYIGRPSPLGNRFTHRASKFPDVVLVSSREEAISRFEEEARNSISILREIERLPEDAILGCWCYPLRCHGDVIIKLWKEIHFKA